MRHDSYGSKSVNIDAIVICQFPDDCYFNAILQPEVKLSSPWEPQPIRETSSNREPICVLNHFVFQSNWTD